MKIALIGYGKMGKEIEAISISRGHEVIFKTSAALTSSTTILREADVAIEFSTPESAANNIIHCLELGVPVVVGTTGWYNRLPEIKEIAHQHDGTLLYSTNFSIGVNIVFHINQMLARIMNSIDEYEPSLKEIHHIHKLDKPSGTAITLAEGIIQELTRKNNWSLNEGDNSSVWIDVERTDEVPGTHHVNYESSIDQIQLTHIAKNRKGFALGAVKAAEWAFNKKGIFTMKDFLKF